MVLQYARMPWFKMRGITTELPTYIIYTALKGCEPATYYLDVGMKAIFHGFRIFS